MSAQLEIVLTEGPATAPAAPAPSASPAAAQPGRSTALVPQSSGASAPGANAGSLAALLGDRFKDLIDLSPHIRLFSGVLVRGANDLNLALAVVRGRGSQGTSIAPVRAAAPPATVTQVIMPPAAAAPAQSPATTPSSSGTQVPATSQPVAGTAEASATASGLATVGKAATGTALAIIGMGAAAFGASKAISAIGQAGRAEAERLSGYSGALAGATAMAQVADMMRDIKRADRIGPQLAAFTMANSRLENAIGDLKNAFLEKTLPALTIAIDRVAESAKIAEMWAKEFEIWMDKQRGDHAERRKDQQDLQRIMQELADIQRGIPAGGDPITNLLMGMAADPANNPFGAPRRLPARAIP